MDTAKNIAILIIVFIFYAIASSIDARATTFPALDCSQPAVLAAVTLAQDGDTVTIPDGSCTWTSGIATTKQITIRALNYTPTPGGNVQRNVILTHNAGSAPLFSFTTGNTFHTQLSGIQFASGGVGNDIEVLGTGSKVMLINDVFIYVNQNFGSSHEIDKLDWQALGGVIWNTRFEGTGTGGPAGVGAIEGTFVISSTRGWETASTMGSADTNGDVNVYIEDSSCFNTGSWPDLDDNGRVVFRNNDIDGCFGVTHGFTSLEGGRHMEWYDNTFSVTTADRNHTGRYVWIRAGTGLFTDNIVNNAAVPQNYGAPALLDIGDNTSPVPPYPQFRQPGWGHNGTADVSDPIYIYSNTGTQASVVTISNGWDVLVETGRDVIIDGGAKPGYAKFTYPHPLRTDLGEQPPNLTVPQNLHLENTFNCLLTGPSTIQLDWTHDATTEEITEYRIYTNTGTGWSVGFTADTPEAGSNQIYSTSKPAANTFYRVTAVNITGESGPSNSALCQVLRPGGGGIGIGAGIGL